MVYKINLRFRHLLRDGHITGLSLAPRPKDARGGSSVSGPRRKGGTDGPATIGPCTITMDHRDHLFQE